MPHRVVILMSDTGGGHRASAEAIYEAVVPQFGNAVDAKLIDFFKQYTPYPFSRFPAWYPTIIARGQRLWGPGFKMSDGARRMRALMAAQHPYARAPFRKLARENPADLYVSVHPLLTMPAVRALGKHRPPFVYVTPALSGI